MSQRVVKYWPIVVTVVTLLGALIVTVYQVASMKSEIVHAADTGTRDRLHLHQKDAQLDKRVTKVEEKIDPIQTQLTRIETNQANVINTIEKIDRRLDHGGGIQ